MEKIGSEALSLYGFAGGNMKLIFMESFSTKEVEVRFVPLEGFYYGENNRVFADIANKWLVWR